MNDDLEKENTDSSRSATFSATQDSKQAPADTKLGTPAVAFQSAEVPRTFTPRSKDEGQEEPVRKRKMSLRRRRKGDEAETPSEEVETADE
ncbi:MAG: hypothetical protein ACO3IA_04215, partial [Candidatus Nanopelagicales bacterium]